MGHVESSPVPWFGIGEERVEKIISKTLRHYALRLRAFPEYRSTQDRMQEIKRCLLAAAGSYNPAKGNISTWISLITRRRCQDLIKVLGRHHRPQRPSDYTSASETGDEHETQNAAPDSYNAMEDVEQFYGDCVELFAGTEPRRPGAAGPTLPQCLSLGYLRNKMGLSIRGLHRYLGRHPATLDVIGMKAPLARTALGAMLSRCKRGRVAQEVFLPHKAPAAQSGPPMSNSWGYDGSGSTRLCTPVRTLPQR